MSTAISCGRPANIDLVGESLERSGKNLQSQQGVEAHIEALYEVEGPWTLMAVPPTGLDIGALTEAKVSETALTHIREAIPRLRGGQYLVQVTDEGLLPRTLSENAVRVDLPFVVHGRGPVWVLATLRRGGPGGPPALVAFSTKSR